MTFRAKLKEEYPEKVDENLAGGCVGCPSNYGYEENYNCNGVTCKDCWNREMPNTEPKVQILPYNADLEKIAYNKGMNDAWELAKKLFAEAQECVLDEIFGKSWSYNSIMKLTPQEAIAKLKAYEEAQSKIEVGDVVKYAGERCLVLDTKGDKVVVLTGDCCVLEWHKCDVEKTGKHIELDELLEKIGE